MATRSRTSAIQYQDFIPKYGLKEETGSHVMVLELPQEFKKEQITITYVQSARMIKVNGERPLVNNKWSRFNQTFSVPQDCDVSKIDARYRNGVLTLTLPKTKPTSPEPAITIKEEQTKPTQQVTPPPPPPPKEPPLEPKPRKGVETSSSLDGLKDGQEETTQTVAPTKDTMKPKDDMDLSQQEESIKKRKKKVAGSDSKKRTELKNGKGLKEGKVEDLIAEIKRNIQEFSMEVNEDRQAMVNIGVAVLVIVALGTYIYNSRGSHIAK